jgi:hypothetical protein
MANIEFAMFLLPNQKQGPNKHGKIYIRIKGKMSPKRVGACPFAL